MSAGPDGAERSVPELAAAICHEAANALAGIRLHADGLDSDLRPAELARISLDLDHLAARAGALLAQIAPLLREPVDAAPVGAASLLDGVAEVLEGEGLRGARLLIDSDAESDAGRVAIEPGLMRCLLLAQVYAVLPARCALRISASAASGSVVFAVEDDGAPDPGLATWRQGALRGRPLACVVADRLLSARGGAVVAERRGDWNRVELRLPAVSP